MLADEGQLGQQQPQAMAMNALRQQVAGGGGNEAAGSAFVAKLLQNIQQSKGPSAAGGGGGAHSGATNPLAGDPLNPNTFIVNHYCGPSRYSANNFAIKNKINRDVFESLAKRFGGDGAGGTSTPHPFFLTLAKASASMMELLASNAAVQTKASPTAGAEESGPAMQLPSGTAIAALYPDSEGNEQGGLGGHNVNLLAPQGHRSLTPASPTYSSVGSPVVANPTHQNASPLSPPALPFPSPKYTMASPDFTTSLGATLNGTTTGGGYNSGTPPAAASSPTAAASLHQRQAMKSQVAQYQLDVEGILSMLRGGGSASKQPLLWIRCVKPTLTMRPNSFDQSLVAQQLAEGGIMRTYKALKGSGFGLRAPLKIVCRDTFGPMIEGVYGSLKNAKAGKISSELQEAVTKAHDLLYKCDYSGLCALLLSPLPSAASTSPTLLDHLVANCASWAANSVPSSSTLPRTVPPAVIQPHASSDNIVQGVSTLFINIHYSEETLVPSLQVCLTKASALIANAAIGLRRRQLLSSDYQVYRNKLRVEAAIRRIAEERPVREALEQHRWSGLFVTDQASRRSFFRTTVLPSLARAAKVQQKFKSTITEIGAEIERALRELATMESMRREKEKQLRLDLDVEEGAAAHRLAEKQKILEAAEKYNEKKRLREYREQQAKIAAEEKKPVSSKREREILDEVAARHMARMRAEKEAARQFTQQIQEQRRSASAVAVNKHLKENVKRIAADSKIKIAQDQQRAVAKDMLLDYTIAQSYKKMEEARRNDLLIHSQTTGNRYEGNTDGDDVNASVTYRNSASTDHRYNIPFAQHIHHKVSPIYALNTAPLEPPGMRFGNHQRPVPSVGSNSANASTPAGLVYDTPNETLLKFQEKKRSLNNSDLEAGAAVSHANASRERAWVMREGRSIEDGARQRVLLGLNDATQASHNASGRGDDLESLVLNSLQQHKDQHYSGTNESASGVANSCTIYADNSTNSRLTRTAAALAIAGRHSSLSMLSKSPQHSNKKAPNSTTAQAYYRDALGFAEASKIVVATEARHSWRESQELWAMQMESRELL
eukprot:GILJ01015092.1.p1 GENE.GILJ01015092.1~~GILJ01015092.1.p1  ORF type:complete len:1170 (+),score=197.52 GILJ01015092.1:328-3510(+)